MMNVSASPKARILPMPSPSLSIEGAIENHSRLSESSAPATLTLRSGQYQLALLSMDEIDSQESRETSRPETSRLFLLPLTWADLLHQIRSRERAGSSPTDSNIRTFGEARIDLQRHLAWRAGKPVPLTALEFKIVCFFLSNADRVVSREELLECVWGYNCYPTTRTVDNKILHLRQKFEPCPETPTHFQTVHGVGYKFVS